MKKTILIIACILISTISFSQNTYYWNGGGVSTGFTTGSNWNRTLGGGGLSRSTPTVNDTLIFDGSNLGAGFVGQITVTNVPYQTVAAIIFRNTADVRFTSSPGTPIPAGTTAAGVQIGTTGNFTGQTITGTGTSFTSFFTVGDFVSTGTTNTGTGATNSIGQITGITNDNSLTQSNGILSMIATNGTSAFFMKAAMIRVTNLLQVEAGSRFEMASSAPLIFKVNPGGVGTINGTIAVTTNFQKLVADSDGTASITFNSGARFQFTGSQSTAPFDAVANPTNNNIIFKAGSIYENNSTTSTSTNSAGNVFGAVIPRSVVEFQKGSTFINNSNTVSSVIGNANRVYPNVILANTTSGWQPTSPVDTLTISSNTTWTNNSNSYFPIKGDLILNGSFASGTASPVFVFCGSVPQNITVNGTIVSSGFARIVIGAGSSLKVTNSFTQNLATNLSTNGSYIRNFGTLDFGNFVVSNAIQNQSGALQGYSTATNTGTQSGATVSAATPHLISVTSATGFSQGMLLSGAGIPANTTVVLVSGTTVTVSNPIPAGIYDIATSVKANGSTFITANAGGIAANYPIQTGSTYSLPSAPGANYFFNAATTTPFPSSLSTVQANNLTLGGAVTSNVMNLHINGTLNLANNMLSIRVADTLRINSGNPIAGVTANSYISLAVNKTTGEKGVLKIANINSATLFPIGTNGLYLPATITPAGSGEDFTIGVFDGATENAMPNGVALSATQKARIVDAVWTVQNNVSLTGNSTLQLGWPASLEGTSFASFPNNQIGIAQNVVNVGWGTFAGSGNNTANTATNSFGSFGAFAVGEIGTSLPVKFGRLNVVALNNNQGKISWQIISEVNTDKYVIEASTDGSRFKEKGFVKATGATEYSFIDLSLLNGVNYYRIKAVDKNGSVMFSNIVKLLVGKNNVEFNIYPNPVKGKQINVSITNTLAEKYSIQITDIAGRIIYTNSIYHSAGSANYPIALPSNLNRGNYILKINASTGVVATTKIIIE